MYTSVVQDYIRAAMETDLPAFVRQVEVPVLVWRSQGAGGLFSWGQTRQSGKRDQPPAARELLRDGHQLPVLPLRQRSLGRPGEVRVGRGSDNDLAIGDDTVSTAHGLFQRNDRTGSFGFEDLGSTNGSRVNGRVLVPHRPVVVFDGDLVELGDAVFIFFTPTGFYQALKSLVG